MKTRTIEKIVRPGTPHFVGDGFRVHNYIPGTSSMERMDPFIMMDYNPKYNFPPSEIPKGVGVHPHKGFETVTIAYKGRIEHGDSSGGGGVIGEGDVQWMTAGNGVLHKEFHETEWSKQGGEFQMVQLWVNLSAENKKSNPKYQAILNTDIPQVTTDDGKTTVSVIAGEYGGQAGVASTFSPIHLLNVKLNQSGGVFSFPSNYTTSLVVIEGAITVNGESVPQDHFVLFRNDGEQFEIASDSQATVLVLSGEPIGEPIAAHGPFVMNTRAELIEAFNEFNEGKFGYLED
ncbi:MAG: pirin family protein [Myroides sp.]|nr:pirin family protein [Myroides sp.]